jgi:choline monooxygenase
MIPSPDHTDLPTFEIDQDITQAQTLPAWVYRDPVAYDAQLRRVFARSWQFVGDADMVRTPMQVQPITILEGSLDEPILLTRDLADRVHCLSNVCTHRGTTLVEKGGHEKTLTCRYHGRRFDLDGTFRFMPEFKETRGFPAEKDNLARVPLATFPRTPSLGTPGPTTSLGRFLFASIEPSVPLSEITGEMERRVGWMPFERFRFVPTRSRDYLVRANWALYCDNYLEGFHIPFVHASLNAVLDHGSYATEIHPYSNLQLGVASDGEEAFDLPASSPDQGKRIAAYYYWLFPNTMFNFYPWGLSINVVRPLGPALTKVSFLSYVWEESKLDRGAGAGLDRVEREDEAVVEAVQRGVRSRFYERGRYSPTREQGVHHFHRLLSSSMIRSQ